MSREQSELQWTTAEAISPQSTLQAKHAGSCCPQSLLFTGTTRFPSRLPGCPADCPYSPRCCSLGSAVSDSHSQAGRALGAPASSTQTEQMTLHAPATAHFQTLLQWNGTFFPRITVPIHLLSKLQAEPGAIRAHISPSKRVHK